MIIIASRTRAATYVFMSAFPSNIVPRARFDIPDRAQSVKATPSGRRQAS